MTKKIIAVCNTKGGVGKSTIFVHLAGWLDKQGHRTLLVDCDAQASSSEWMAEADPDIDTIQINNADDVINRITDHVHEYDYIIADGPGSNSDISRLLLMIADLAVLPCKASILEARALTEASKQLLDARKVRHGKPPAMIILNMVQPRYKLAAEMRSAAQALQLPMVKTPLTIRQAVADAPGQATFTWKMKTAGSRISAAEMQDIFIEILPEAAAKKKNSNRRNKAAKT